MDAPPTYDDACDDPAKIPPRVSTGCGSLASPLHSYFDLAANEGQMIGTDTPTLDSEAGEPVFKHTVLVSAVASPDGSLEQLSVHHWNHWHHGSSNSSFVIPTNVKSDDIRHISGFHELGTFPIPASRSWTPERHACLSTLAGDADVAGQQGIDVDRALTKRIVAGLREAGPVPTSQEAAELKLYSVEVATRTEDGLATGNADEMVWNWVKPASLYLKKGSWYRTMDEAVVDGVWRAGMGFSMSVEVVGEERKKRMFERGHGRP